MLCRHLSNLLSGLVLSVTSYCMLAADEAPPPPADPFAFLPKDVAKAKAFTISDEEVRQIGTAQLARLQQSGQTATEDQCRQLALQITNFLVDRELIRGQATDDGFAPETDKAGEQVDKMEAQYGKEGFAKVLQAQGMTRDALVSRMAEDLALKSWVDAKVMPKLEVPDDKVESFYNERKDSFKVPEQKQASHILIPVAADASEQDKAAAKAKAEELLGQLTKGADFAKLAKENSSCPSAKRGGDLGFFGRGQMDPAFEAAAFGLEPGKLTGPVETRFGYHIIKGGELKEAHQMALEEVRPKIVEHLKRGQLGQQLRTIAAALRDKAGVQILLKAAAPATATP